MLWIARHLCLLLNRPPILSVMGLVFTTDDESLVYSHRSTYQCFYEHDDFTGSQSSLDCVRVISINFISLPTFLGLEIKKNCWLFFRFVTLHASCIYFLRQPYWFEPMSIPSSKHCATFILIRKLDDLCSYITKWPVYRIHILSTKFGEP